MDKPTSGQSYFYVSSKGKIEEENWSGSETDKNRLQFNNVFTERTRAQKHLKTITKATEREMAHA